MRELRCAHVQAVQHHSVLTLLDVASRWLDAHSSCARMAMSRAQTPEYVNSTRVLGLPGSMTSEAWIVFAVGLRGSLIAVELSHLYDMLA